MSIGFLAIDTLVKSLDIQDCGTHIKYMLSHQSGPLPIQIGDEVLGFVSQGVNQFRSIFKVVSVDAGSSTVVLEKVVERAEGVPLRLSDSGAKLFLSSLKSGKDLFVPDQALAQSIRDLLLNGGVFGNLTRNDVVNRLSIALKRFAQERADGDWKDDYENVNTDVRSFFEPLNADAVSKMDAAAFKDFCINHTWSLTNGAAWSIVSQYSNDERKRCCEFFARLFSDPNPSTVFNGDHPKGVRSSCISELLMKFSPERFGFYNETSHKSLVWLGLLDGEFDRKYGWFQYGLAQGVLSTIVQKMRELGIRSTLNDDAPPADFLAANEFLWFVHENKKLIQEEVNKMQLKDAKSTPVANKGKQLDLDPNKENDKLMLRLMASLRAKPFVILAGHSGTGKSRLVRKLAYMTCNVEELRDPEDGALNFCMIQVKPNWHDSADLLGYRSAIKDNRYVGTKLLEFLFRAYAYPGTPFFLCLDEMNLAPVEQYFAEFLSAMESVRPVDPADKDGTGPFSSDKIVDLDVDKDRNLDELGCGWVQSFEWVKTHGITIPKNLFVVGTVNMDETTCQFSRKVLDRAMTIEMTNVNFDDYGSVSEPSFDDLLDGNLISTLLNRPVRIEKLDDEDKDPDSPLRAVQTCLENTPFAVAYRFANEYSLYKRALDAFDPGRKMGFDALDHAVLMKVLPRISGERRYVSELFCGHEDDTQKDSPQKGSLLAVFKDDSSSSRKKMRDILDRKGRYLTFWP